MSYDRVHPRPFRLLSRLPVGIIALSGGILVGSLAISVTPYAIHVPSTVGQFLGTLALAQASVLAIVFSVVILAVQLTASKYSTQITDLYVRSPVFIVTFSLFLVSIGVDVALLYAYPTFSGSVTRSAVYAAAGLALVVAVWLVYFIQFTFRQLTPAGIVSMFEEEITPGRSLRLLRSGRDDHLDQTEMNHPLLPLHSLTVQAIQNEERFMAVRALREFGTQMVAFIEETSADGSLDAETIDLMYEPVLTVYLPEIVELAQERGMEEIAEQALDWMHRIGRAGNDASTDRVSRIASDGFEALIDRGAADPTKHQTFVASWERWGALASELCGEADVGTIHHVFSGFEQQLNLVEKQEHEEWVRQRVLFRFCTDIQRCHDTLLDRFGATVDDLDISWENRFLPTNNDREKMAAQLLIKSRNLVVLFSTIVLDHLVETGEYPIPFNSFQGFWADICSSAARHALGGYTRTIHEIYIEVAFVSLLYERNAEAASIGTRHQVDVWASTLERIARTEGDAPVVAAFEAVLDEETTRYLSVRSYPSITRTEAYPDLVERLRTAVEA